MYRKKQMYQPAAKHTYNRNKILNIIEEFYSEVYHLDLQPQDGARKGITETQEVTKDDIKETL